MLREKARVAGPGGSAVALLWGLYSNTTTLVELPDKAGTFAKLLADPPVYLPWMFLGAFVIVAIWAFWPSSTEPVAPRSASQSSSGSHSVNIGTNHGPVTVASPPPAATQPARSPYGSGHPPINISTNAMRGAEKLPPLRPNYRLTKLGSTVAANIEPPTEDRAINLAIADWVVQEKVTVWGRYEDLPLEEVYAADLKNAKFDFRKGIVRYANDYHVITLTDVQFNKSEVDSYWL
jgi:hypothetical protein